jgi:SsrA-binding protein
LFLYNSHIDRYKNSSPFVVTYEQVRPRKLLLNRRELNRLSKAIEQKGMTIIPLKLYRNDKGLIKVDIALAKGKHTYDKKKDLMKSDLKRYAERQIKIS